MFKLREQGKSFGSKRQGVSRLHHLVVMSFLASPRKVFLVCVHVWRCLLSFDLLLGFSLKALEAFDPSPRKFSYCFCISLGILVFPLFHHQGLERNSKEIQEWTELENSFKIESKYENLLIFCAWFSIHHTPLGGSGQSRISSNQAVQYFLKFMLVAALDCWVKLFCVDSFQLYFFFYGTNIGVATEAW